MVAAGLGWTELHSACMSGDREQVERLLYEATDNIEAEMHDCPFHIAGWKGTPTDRRVAAVSLHANSRACR